MQHWQWSAAGQLLAHQDGNGQQRRWRYNLLGQVSAELDPLGQRTELDHNALGELQALRDAAGNRTRFEHDAAGRLIAQTGSDAVRTEYTLNAQGWPVQVLEHAGHASGADAPQGAPGALRTLLQRDAMGRLTAKRLAHSLTHYRYGAGEGHGAGEHITQVSRWAADPLAPEQMQPQPHWPLWDEHRFEHDPHGRLAQESNRHWPQQPVPEAGSRAASEPAAAPAEPVHSYTLRHQHDALGTRTATRLPQGGQLNYLHYGSGHLHQINLDGRVVSDIERDALHQEAQRSQGRLQDAGWSDGLRQASQ